MSCNHNGCNSFFWLLCAPLTPSSKENNKHNQDKIQKQEKEIELLLKATDTYNDLIKNDKSFVMIINMNENRNMLRKNKHKQKI